ncbi:MAG: hypothetical protein WC788_08340 [Candidatus Paceibacterota bacterium]|jgi:hypothetical protein
MGETMGVTRAKTKGGEGMVELMLVLTMPVWLPIQAIQIMYKQMQEEAKKKRDREGE